MSERKSFVVLELKNRIGGPLRQIRRQVSRQTAGIRHSFASVTKQVRRIGIGLGALAGVGVASIAKLTTGVAKNGDKIAKFADQIGLGIEALQEFQFVAERQGVSQETLNKGLEAFSERLGKARNGAGTLATYLKKANPELLKQLVVAENLEDAFTLYLKAIEATENTMDKAAGTAAAFGRSAQNMSLLVRDGSKNVDDLRQRAHDLGRVLSEKTTRGAEAFQDSLTDMSSAVGGVRNIIGGALLPAISSIMDEITKGVIDNAGAIRVWAKEFASHLPERFEQFKAGVIETVREVKAFVKFIGGWKNALIGVGIVLAGPLLTSILGLGVALVTLGSNLKLITAAQWLFNAALTANPIGLAVTAIAGLIALLVSLGVGFDDVTRVVNEAVDYWKKAFDGWLGAFRQSWTSAVEYVKDKVRAIKDIVPDWMQNAIGGTIKIAGDARDLASGAIRDTYNGAKGVLGYGKDDPPAPTQSASRPRSLPRQEVGVGGTLNILIDSMGRATVRDIRQHGPMDIDVDSGPLLLRG